MTLIDEPISKPSIYEQIKNGLLLGLVGGGSFFLWAYCAWWTVLKLYVLWHVGITS